MTCDEFSERITDYIEGETNRDDRATLDRHVSDCPLCARLLTDMRALTERLAHLPRIQPSAGFDFALRSRILMEMRGQRRWQRRVQAFLFSSASRTVLSMAAAAVLVLGVTAVLVERQSLRALEPVHIRQSVTFAPARSMDRGTLKLLSQEESFEISGRFYRSGQDTLKQSRKPAKGDASLSDVRRVTVRF